MMSAKPCVKWVGGKTQLLPELSKYYPAKGSFSGYHEPFVGGGAVFFDLASRGLLEDVECHLSDDCGDLVCVYQVVRDNLKQLLGKLRKLEEGHRKDPKTHYYAVRAESPTNNVERAAHFIYLNKTCFNGLYRVNQREGKFNVPMGSHKKPTICDEENLRACSEVLTTARIHREDFSLCVKRLGHGDFVYFDPPYLPASKTAKFTNYTRGSFGMDEHKRLVDVVRRADAAGAMVLLSSSDSPESRDLYEGLFKGLFDEGVRIAAVKARRNVNSDITKRGTVGEIIVSNSRLREHR